MPPINRRIGLLKPWHAEDHGVDSNRSDKEGVTLGGAGDREVEGNLTIGVCEYATIGGGDLDWETWFGG